MNRIMIAGLLGLLWLGAWSVPIVSAMPPQCRPSDMDEEMIVCSLRVALTTNRFGVFSHIESCLRRDKSPILPKDLFTPAGLQLCNRLSKIQGVERLDIKDYTAQITKAKTFQWDELDAALQKSFAGL
jgi:hypothetical protein